MSAPAACREFVLFFSVMDEGSSLFLARNIANFLPDLAGGTTVIVQASTDEAVGVRHRALRLAHAHKLLRADPRLWMPPRPPRW